MTERPIPPVAPDQVLIRVQATGICGTDLHIANWDAWAAQTVPIGITVGHEFCGEIVACGETVSGLEPGMFVSGEGHIVCGQCRACRAGRRHLCINTIGIGVHCDGAFAEYVAMPATNVWVHRGEVSPSVAAIFDPFGNAVHTALQFPCLGEDVLVTGAGPIGIMAALVAKHAGARNVVVTDISQPRLDLARKLGVDATVNVTSEVISDVMPRLGLREGFDVGLEMSGAPGALNDMFANVTHGARIALLGIPSKEIKLDLAKVVLNMITLRGVYGREMFETWYAMSVLLEAGLDISGVITDEFDAADYEAAFAAAGNADRGKVVLHWS